MEVLFVVLWPIFLVWVAGMFLVRRIEVIEKYQASTVEGVLLEQKVEEPITPEGANSMRLLETPILVFDVESIGIHGEAFAVAGGVYINGAQREGFMFSCPPDAARGDQIDRTWVIDNTPVFSDTHRSPKAVRFAFWEKLTQLRAKYGEGMLLAADCGWPVESAFLIECIADDPQERKWKGPYPLLEISSIMYVAGMDPMLNHERRSSELPVHNPYADSVQSARLLYQALQIIKGRETNATSG